MSETSDKEYAGAYFRTLYGINSALKKFSADLELLDQCKISKFSKFFLSFAAKNIGSTNSQLFQDLFVVFITEGKRGGVFVEFGAVDGVYLSNTLLLERDYYWTGLLGEPSHKYLAALRSQRKAKIETACIWSRSGEMLSFTDTDAVGYGTLSEFRDGDEHAVNRQNASVYDVPTISLNDLFKKHNLRNVEYMSIDTEGSEDEILSTFDLTEYRPCVLMVEHNHDVKKRASVENRMSSAGYTRVLSEITLFEDWFVRTDFLDAFCVRKFSASFADVSQLTV